MAPLDAIIRPLLVRHRMPSNSARCRSLLGRIYWFVHHLTGAGKWPDFSIWYGTNHAAAEVGGTRTLTSRPPRARQAQQLPHQTQSENSSRGGGDVPTDSDFDLK